MSNEEEILQLVREIREEQKRHHAEWRQVIDRAEQRYEQTRKQSESNRRFLRVILIVLVVVCAVTYGLSELMRLVHDLAK